MGWFSDTVSKAKKSVSKLISKKKTTTKSTFVGPPAPKAKPVPVSKSYTSPYKAQSQQSFAPTTKKIVSAPAPKTYVSPYQASTQAKTSSSSSRRRISTPYKPGPAFTPVSATTAIDVVGQMVSFDSASIAPVTASTQSVKRRDVQQAQQAWQRGGFDTRGEWEKALDVAASEQRRDKAAVRKQQMKQEQVVERIIEYVPSEFGSNFNAYLPPSRFELYGRWGRQPRTFKSFKKVRKFTPGTRISRRATKVTPFTGLASLSGRQLFSSSPLTKMISNFQTQPIQAKSIDIRSKIW